VPRGSLLRGGRRSQASDTLTSLSLAFPGFSPEERATASSPPRNPESADSTARAEQEWVGPCFPSSTKSFERFATPEFLGRVAAEVSLPAFAIGGITLDRLDEVFACGLHRVAVAAAVTRARDPAAAARSLLDRLGEAGPRSAEGSPS